MHKKDLSYGILALQKKEGQWFILLIKHGAGHWAFPKGHPDHGEKPKEAAARELHEEVALQVVRFLDIPELKEQYSFRSGGHLIHKTVIYFAAEVAGEVAMQEEEIIDYKWVSLSQASAHVTFKEAKKVLETLTQLLD